MKKATFGIAALPFAFAAAAAAQNAQNPATNPGSTKTAPPQFRSLDTNKDGRVSKDEVKSHADITSSFATLDSDRDTYLSETEYGKWNSSTTPGASSTEGNKPPPANNAPQSGSDSQSSGSRSTPPANSSPQSSGAGN
jgi:hypothetical protein